MNAKVIFHVLIFSPIWFYALRKRTDESLFLHVKTVDKKLRKFWREEHCNGLLQAEWAAFLLTNLDIIKRFSKRGIT